MTPNLDPKHPDNLKDPYPMFRWLRENAPVHWNDELHGWLVTRYDDVFHILQNPRIFSSDRFRRTAEQGSGARASVRDVARVLKEWMVFRDPPDHTRLRGLLNLTFTPRRLEAMRPRIQSVVDDLLGQAAERGQMDFIADFAFPLPATVIAIMLGAPLQDIGKIKLWSDRLGAFLGGAQTEHDNMEQARDGIYSLRDYFRELIPQRKSNPGEDLISLMLAAEEDGDMLSEDEVVHNCILLLFAGHETTTNLLGNGLLHLLRNPAQHELLRNDPSLAASAVEEFLRFDSSVPGVVKLTTEPTTIRGQEIDAGTFVVAFLSSANRDPAKFKNPDELDITRRNNRHLSFAFGIHYCLGAPLARLESQIAFTTLFQRLDDLVLLNDDPPWLPQIFLRGLESLPIGFQAARQARAAGR